MANFLKSGTGYQSGLKDAVPVFELPGRFDAGSGRIGKLGICRDYDGNLILVKSDVSAPTWRGRVGCHTKWIPAQRGI